MIEIITNTPYLLEIRSAAGTDFAANVYNYGPGALPPGDIDVSAIYASPYESDPAVIAAEDRVEVAAAFAAWIGGALHVN